MRLVVEVVVCHFLSDARKTWFSLARLGTGAGAQTHFGRSKSKESLKLCLTSANTSDDFFKLVFAILEVIRLLSLPYNFLINICFPLGFSSV